MAGYILFIRDIEGSKMPTAVSLFGLSDIGSDDLSCATVAQGPHGMRGAIGGWLKGDSSDPKLDVIPGQKWIPLPETEGRKEGDVWIGIMPNKSLRPSDIARKKQFAGNEVTLRDGNPWLIPAAQQLPHRLAPAPKGGVTRLIEDRFESYYTSAFEAMQDIYGALGMWTKEHGFQISEPTDEIQTVTIQEGVKLACEGLSINYRLNQDVALALDLLDENCLAGIISCTFDMPTLMQVENEKKNEDRVSIPVTYAS